MNLRLISLLLLGSLSLSAAAEDPKDGWTAHILRQSESEDFIPDLKFQSSKIPVRMIPNKGDLRPFVEIVLIFSKKDWKLFVSDQEVRSTGKSGQFIIPAFLNSRINEIQLVARGPDGQEERELVYLFAPEAMQLKVISPWHSVSIATGLAGLFYSQNTYGSFNGFSGVISASYMVPEKWNKIGLSTDISSTFLTFQSSPINANPQLVQAAGELTYLLPSFGVAQARFRLLGGVGFLTMISNGSPFGFSNLFGPSAGLKYQKYLDDQKSWNFEFRLLPFSNPALASNRGLLLRLYWSGVTSHQRRIDLGGSISDYTFKPDANTTIGVQTFSVTVGLTI